MLLLAGTLDLSTPLEWAQRAAARAPGGKLVVVENAGHGVQNQKDPEMLETPARVRRGAGRVTRIPWRPARSGTAPSTFGLVNVPVKVYTATESKSIRFHQVHLDDGARIEHRRVCPKEDKEVPNDEIVKGYELSNGKFVELTKEEIAAAAGENAKLIDVEHFVEGEEIDPAYYDKTYYLGAGDKGEDAYRLLKAALDKSGKVAIGRWVFHDRERLVAVRPVDDLLAHAHHELPRRGGRARRPRPAEPAEEPVRARDRDGGQARQVAAGEVRAGVLRGHLSRGGAGADRAQAQGRGDRGARGAPAQRRQRRPDEGAGGEL